jgi:predicted RNA methylase
MKLKHLQSLLESVQVFESPDIGYEQYPTPPHLAAQIAQMMHSYGDVQGKAVGDLGVGCGILTIATHLMGSASAHHTLTRCLQRCDCDSI